jgi:PAS domain S-box-containing protein
MSTDVTHIKRLEERLRQSQQRYRLLFEEVPCYISIQDADLRTIEVNRAFRESFGSSLGSHCYQIYKHRNEPCLVCPVRDTFEDGQPHTREEVVTSLQGKQFHTLVTTAPIRDGNGQIVSVMEMSADITEVRKLQSHLTSLGLLIGSVSHALKGLLNGLAGGMYLVETGYKKDNPDRVRQGWEIVQRNVGRIRATVSDILYYAKDREPLWELVSAVPGPQRKRKPQESTGHHHHRHVRGFQKIHFHSPSGSPARRVHQQAGGSRSIPENGQGIRRLNHFGRFCNRPEMVLSR